MKTLLICHEGTPLDERVLAKWLNSFSDLVGVVLVQESSTAIRRRIRREIKRVGVLRFLDVLSFRLYYRFFLARRDRLWERQKIEELSRIYKKAIPADTPTLKTSNANTLATEQFMKRLGPDLVLARCKSLLKESIFSIPAKGTFVMHPGICPEYRNAHGCFWALTNRDLGKVGMTLLRINRGVDTGPVFGYYTYPYDEVNESHIVIQHRAVLENLDALRTKLLDISNGTALPLDTEGRSSMAWGQPWLSRYLCWKLKVRKRQK